MLEPTADQINTERRRQKKQIRWTPYLERVLIDRWEANVSSAAIADEVGVSASSVVNKARCLGLERRSSDEWPSRAVEELKRMWAEGVQARQIGLKLGKTKNSVISKANRMGLESRARDPVSPQQRLENRRAWARTRDKSRHRNGFVKLRPERKKQEPVFVPWEGSKNIALLDLGREQCRYSYSDEKPFLFCGQPTLAGSSWCSHCDAIVHARVSEQFESARASRGTG